MTDSGSRSGVIVLDPRTSPAQLPDLAEAIEHSVRVCFGALAIVQGAVLRLVVDPTPARSGQRSPVAVVDVADLVMGSVWGSARVSGRLVGSGVRVAAPLATLLVRPPLVPRRLQPQHAARRVIEGWRRDRPDAVGALRSWSASALPDAVDAVLAQLNLSQLVAAVMARVDVDALVSDVLSRVDLTSASEQVMARLDLDRVVGSALRSVDVTTIVATVLRDLDLDRIVAEAVNDLDLDTAVRRGIEDVDVNRVAAQVLAKVDLAPVVSAALDQLDLTRIVVDRVDLVAVAELVVDGIDLPSIIRGSTGSVASEAVRAMRVQGVEGDDALARVVDRLLHRRRDRRLAETPNQHSASGATPPSDNTEERS